MYVCVCVCVCVFVCVCVCVCACVRVCVSSFYGAPLDANIANTKTWKRRVDSMSILNVL